MSLVQQICNSVYDAYEKKLLKKIQECEIPNHIAIIMDGNRRFAEKLGMSEIDGHKAGKQKLEDVLTWCLEIRIKILTVYAFSTENFKRTDTEIKMLMNLFGKSFKDAADDPRIHQNKIRIRAIGKLDLLPKDVYEAVMYAEEKTKDYNNYFLNIAVAYGGREEIINAIKKIALNVKNSVVDINEINEDMVSSYLYTSEFPDPDLIFRTSGEERLSNFLLWQTAYAELYFADVYWPALRKIDFLRVISSYQDRKRKFGK